MPMRLPGLSSGMDTESIVTELMRAQRMKSTKVENKITKLEWIQDKWKSLNTKLYSFYTGPLSKLRMQGSFSTKEALSSNDNKATATVASNAPAGTHLLKIKQLANAQFETGNRLNLDVNSQEITVDTKLVDLGMASGEGNNIVIDTGKEVKTFTITDTTTVGDFVQSLKNAGLNASYDTKQKRFFISSKESGSANAFSISVTGATDLSKLGLSTITKTANADGTISVAGGVNLVAATNAKIVYNGTEIENSSNVVTVNGLTLTLKNVTSGANTADTSDDEVISINVKNNTQAVYDMIKGFVKSYNELLKEMNDSYYAASSKGYEPLTDEERESMTDDQIEKWENKIKDSLLRRDNNLNSLLSTLRSSLGESVEIDGKKYSMASFGVRMGDYTEKGILHINGDADDSLMSGLTNDLMEALTEDPDKVMNVFTKVANKVYKSMTEDMKSTSLRSALTFYNDKEITKSITNYKSELKRMESKLTQMENRYYKQFTAMETALAKMNSQSSSLMSMLGNNQ